MGLKDLKVIMECKGTKVGKEHKEMLAYKALWVLREIKEFREL